jgi:hypothetical protein
MFDNEPISRDVIQRVLTHYQQVKQHLYENGHSDSPDIPFQNSLLKDEIKLLVQVANGEFDRATVNDQTIGQVMETLQDVIDLLFARVSGPYAYAIPNSFWSQPGIGQVLARVQAWLRHDDLMSYTEAAQLLFNELAQQNIQAARMRLMRLVKRGELMSYVALDEANPTQRMRVSRQAVEALLAAEMTRPKKNKNLQG